MGQTRKRKQTRSRRRPKQRGGQQAPFITIYLMCFNEEVLLPFTVNHYKKQFSSSRIVVCDNESTDNSVQIAKSLGCEIYSFSTGGQFSEEALTKVRNTIWKSAQTDWVILADMDEILCITEKQVRAEQAKGVTVIRSEAYDMIGESKTPRANNIDISSIAKGTRLKSYDKLLCFNRTQIQEMNYSLGSHESNPTGTVKLSEKPYRLYHFKYLGEQYYMGLAKGYKQRRAKAGQFQELFIEDLTDEKIAAKYKEKLANAAPVAPLKSCAEETPQT